MGPVNNEIKFFPQRKAGMTKGFFFLRNFGGDWRGGRVGGESFGGE